MINDLRAMALKDLPEEKKDEYLRKFREELKKLNLYYAKRSKELNDDISTLETEPRLSARQKANKAKKAARTTGLKSVENK
jgi:hypothetical protein